MAAWEHFLLQIVVAVGTNHQLLKLVLLMLKKSDLLIDREAHISFTGGTFGVFSHIFPQLLIFNVLLLFNLKSLKFELDLGHLSVKICDKLVLGLYFHFRFLEFL